MESNECDTMIIYCYYLYDSSGKVLDVIGHVEYCNEDSSGELMDFKWEWRRL
ncbi:hypothetical protein D3C77_569910 [compost metagenome]